MEIIITSGGIFQHIIESKVLMPSREIFGTKLLDNMHFLICLTKNANNWKFMTLSKLPRRQMSKASEHSHDYLRSKSP